jgi:L-fuculose-phosphate aldolase
MPTESFELHNGWSRGAVELNDREFEDLVTTVTRLVMVELNKGTEHRLDLDGSDLLRCRSRRLQEDIAKVGRKLWQRGYVDGPGGNISARLSSDRVLCTPTMLSKWDLTPEDICTTDLEGNSVEGTRPKTSELLLHLAIYKACPEAQGVVHCHPPHATAWSLTETGPPTGYLVEQEIFVGRVPLAGYETPGTRAFAETVLPHIGDCNSVLLANHGIVCWASSVTRAEWMVEIIDTYCHTMQIASMLGVPLRKISAEKLADLEQLRHRVRASSLMESDVAEAMR